MRPKLLLGLFVSLVALLATGLAVASADEGDDLPETFITRLEPGDNLVGWVGKAAPVEDLIEAVPQIELVYAWDADWGRYRYAVPGIDTSGKSLDELTAETSVVIRVGNEPLKVTELLAAVPEIQLIYRWDALAQHWDFALRPLGSDHWTLDLLPPGATATIRIGAEPMTAQALFRAAPQIDLMYRYDQSDDSYAYAISGLTPAVGGLNVLTPGMGVVVRLHGEESVEWVRPRRPAQGTVSLRAGRNLVAWMGRDEAPLGMVRRGIGRSFIQVGLWSSDAQDATFIDSDGVEASGNSHGVRFGSAVWIHVARPMRWLQPTGMMPEVVFAGQIPNFRKAKVNADIRSVMDFYAEQFGLEADFSDILVYIPTSARQLILAQDSHSQLPEEMLSESRENRLSFLRDRWSSAAGWASPGHWFEPPHMVIKQELWGSSNPVRGGIHFGRSVTAHEYMHVIQHQLHGVGLGINRPPNWFVEGAAEWVEDALIYATDGLPWDRLQADARRWSQGNPALITIEQSTDLPYGVGRAAAHLLAESAADDSLIELYRVVAGNNIGSHQQWKSWPTWDDAFHEVFGISIDDFHHRFEEWRGGNRGGGTHGHAHSPPFLSGRVLARGALQSQLDRVRIIVKGELDNGLGTYSYDWVQVGRQFDFPVERNGTYLLAVEYGDPPCIAYYSKNGAVQEIADAHTVEMRGATLPGLDLVLSDDTCSSRLEGTLLTEGGQPLVGVPVTVKTNQDRVIHEGQFLPETTTSTTKIDGSFSVFVPLSELRLGDSDIHFRLRDDCGVRMVSRNSLYQESLRWAPGAEVQYVPQVLTPDWDDFVLGTLEGPPDLRIEINDEICTYRIEGQLTRDDGKALSQEQIRISYEREAGWSWSTEVHEDGSFALTVPDEGLYFLRVSLDGCHMYYRDDGFAGSRELATPIEIAGDDAVGVRFKVPAGACSTIISGRLLDAVGHPIAEIQVYAWAEDGTGSSAQTDSEGSFDITLPGPGQFRVNAWVDGCTVYYSSDGATGLHGQATLIRVSEADVTGVLLQLAEGMCEHRISGKLVNADGSPRSGQWVSTSGNAGSAGAWSGSDGLFSVAVPANGSYRLSVWIDDCSIYRGIRGPVKDWNSASQVRVSNADVTGIEFRLPEDPSSLCE